MASFIPMAIKTNILRKYYFWKMTKLSSNTTHCTCHIDAKFGHLWSNTYIRDYWHKLLTLLKLLSNGANSPNIDFQYIPERDIIQLTTNNSRM